MWVTLFISFSYFVVDELRE